MALVAQLSCDRMWRDGSCAAKSSPALSERDAIRAATDSGWYFRHGRNGEPDLALCPIHSGRDALAGARGGVR